MAFTTLEQMMLDDGPVAYRRLVNGRPPLLLIHGWGGTSRHWQDAPEHLGDIRDLYALDLPGHGETPPRARTAHPRALAELVIAVADRLGLARFDLNGHSWGAAVAILVAAHWPERVDRLVLTSLGTARHVIERLAMTQAYHQMTFAMHLWRPWLTLYRPWLELARPALDWVGSHPEVYRAIASQVLHRLPEDDALIRLGVQELLGADPITALEYAIAAGSPMFLNALETMATPTLLVNGANDRIMPPSGGRALAAFIRDVRRVEMADCGHFPMVEQPAPYHRLVGRFLTGEA
ncbi:MAG: alpha/beta hydrolase [Sphingobacteriia bacterium]|nr:alpha/beta hydrolase [Sphingobacteriia bacterium]NCC39231.1 alpha/beta hydrolase [Gammaproteobacteria bacterium]